MQKDDIRLEKHKIELRTTLLSVKQSSIIAFLVLVTPLLFFASVILEANFDITGLNDFMLRYPLLSSPWVLIGSVIVSIIVLSFSIIHKRLEWDAKEIVFTIAIKRNALSLILMITSIGILLVFLGYGLVENGILNLQ